MIIGTAGHIDHGKTALVRALTGVETDRLPEEQRRGITIDLGYAYQPLPSGEVLGFVDVPGHEKLVHTMVAGAAGIDFVLLVVAADDGPMPQTREHLQVLDLLGLHQGAVALTKIDRVRADRAAQATWEVEQLLAGTGLAGIPIFPVSAMSGEGIAELHTYLVAADAGMSSAEGAPAWGADGQRSSPRAERQTPAHLRHFRLAIDRSFTLAGIGTLVTGTVYSGLVRLGDQLLIAPAGREARVRSLHAQDRPAEVGRAGQRCALNLVGPEVHHDSIHRGDWVVDPALCFAIDRLSAELRLLPDEERPLRHWSPVHLHLGAAHVMARVGLLEGDTIAPGGRGLVDLVLERPIAALNGDRCILRDASARRTLGGARVLDIAPPRRGQRRPQRLAWLHAFAARSPMEAAADALGQLPQGLALEPFRRQWNLSPEEAARLQARPDAFAIPAAGGPVLIARAHWQAWRDKVLAALAGEHARHPEFQGPDRERLRRIAAPVLERGLFGRLVDELLAEQAVIRTGPWLHLPGHRLGLGPEEEALWSGRIAPLLEEMPFNPPRVRDVAKRLDLDEEQVRRLMKQLSGMGQLHPVAQDHYFTRAAVGRLAAIARELADQQGAATAAVFRDRIGGGRKVAIHILEFFDRIGYSRRIGDDHRIFRDSLLDLGADSGDNPK